MENPGSKATAFVALSIALFPLAFIGQGTMILLIFVNALASVNHPGNATVFEQAYVCLGALYVLGATFAVIALRQRPETQLGMRILFSAHCLFAGLTVFAYFIAQNGPKPAHAPIMSLDSDSKMKSELKMDAAAILAGLQELRRNKGGDLTKTHGTSDKTLDLKTLCGEAYKQHLTKGEYRIEISGPDSAEAKVYDQGVRQPESIRFWEVSGGRYYVVSR